MYNADRAENQNLVSALSITINKILCQFFEFTQNLRRSLKKVYKKEGVFQTSSLILMNIRNVTTVTLDF